MDNILEFDSHNWSTDLMDGLWQLTAQKTQNLSDNY